MVSAIIISGVLVLLLLVPYQSSAQNSGNKKSFVIKVEDFKDFKKLLRTKTNLLVICAQSEKATAKVIKLFEEVAEEMKGKATLAYINCGDDKKFCKKLKVSPNVDFELKHYKDGEFNKDYDRKLTLRSMVNFLLDPTGDLPWEEDPTANDVVHISSEDGFNKLLRKEKNPILAMFYAPWCGYCKQLKPQFAEAATELKEQVILAGVDVDKPPMMPLRLQYNITGFPTLYYFQNGRVKYKYGGENNKAGIVSWLQNPHPPREKEKEQEWSDEASEVVHLTDNTYHDFLKENPSVLVMFYAPWCGHCKKMKPGYTEAAQILKDQGVVGVLAAVDATKETKIAQEQGVKGFPTVKYFKNGEYAFEFHERDKDKIVDFMINPTEPPPPPAPEPRWEEVESEVVHLTDDSFKPFLKKKKHCLIMFYAPWCGHCKKAKPEFMAAAEKFKSDPKVAFAAMDCTVQTVTCKANDVTGYPTFKYFNYGKNSQKYMGGREEGDFIAFMNDPLNPSPTPHQPPASESLEVQWKAHPGYTYVKFLNRGNFNQTVSESAQVLVMFYAPWCGHCKKMKPDFAEAAQIVNSNLLGLLAAVDATQEKDLADRYNVKGYPTLLFFTGDSVTEYSSGRSRQDLVSFMSKALYADEADDVPLTVDAAAAPPFFLPQSVKGLTKSNFNQALGTKGVSTLVMFYDPSDAGSRSAKPHFVKAAKTTAAGSGTFAAVDCSRETEMCAAENVKSFPEFKVYLEGKSVSKYDGIPTFASLRNFLATSLSGSQADSPSPKSEQGQQQTTTKSEQGQQPATSKSEQGQQPATPKREQGQQPATPTSDQGQQQTTTKSEQGQQPATPKSEQGQQQATSKDKHKTAPEKKVEL